MLTELLLSGQSGSLKPGIAPGSLVIPTDYISLTDIPSLMITKLNTSARNSPSDLSKKLSKLVPSSRYGGVYAQTRGPRLETVAEVDALGRVADVVGMTVASEATLACELGMEFAALCTIDNYANGLGGEVLTYEHILSSAKVNRTRTEEILMKIIGQMG